MRTGVKIRGSRGSSLASLDVAQHAEGDGRENFKLETKPTTQTTTYLSTLAPQCSMSWVSSGFRCSQPPLWALNVGEEEAERSLEIKQEWSWSLLQHLRSPRDLNAHWTNWTSLDLG